MQFRAARSLKECKHAVRKHYLWHKISHILLGQCSQSGISHNSSLTIGASADSSYVACVLTQLVVACREVLFVYYRKNTIIQIVMMVNTCEHISWPQGRPSHLQSLQPFEEVLEGLEQAAILPVEDKWIECCWKHKQYNHLFWSCYQTFPDFS